MTKTDDLVHELQVVLENKKSELKKLKNQSKFKTNRILPQEDGGVNLATINDMKTLIRVAGQIKQQKKQYEEIVKQFSIEKAPEFTIGIYSVEDWLSDIELQINKLNIKVKEEVIKKLEERLESIMSPELKAKREIAKITEEISNI